MLNKFWFVIFLLVVFTTTAMASSPPEQDDEGRYILGNATQLKWFRDAVNNGEAELNAILSANIDLGGQSWTPIGANMETSYNGSFDGNGHVIRSFIAAGDSPLLGLFGCADYGSEISALRVENATVSFTGDIEANVGVIAGMTRGIIRDCSAAKSIVGATAENENAESVYAGVITGTNDEGVIISCVAEQNTVMVASSCANYKNAAAGGICGVNIGTMQGVGLLMNCKSLYNEISLVIGDSQVRAYSGGAVGLSLGGILMRCEIAGGKSVCSGFAGSALSLGGIIGSAMLGGYIENCAVGGDILLRAENSGVAISLGAVAGELLRSSVSGCLVKNVILSLSGKLPHNIGGIAGAFAGGKISDCRITNLLLPKNINTQYNVGAVAGIAIDIEIFGETHEAVIENTFFNRTIAGGTAVGIYSTPVGEGAISFDPMISPDIIR